MDVFDLDRFLVSDYERFARSFTHIRAPDIKQQLADIYASRKFWPEPLISINPHFEWGPYVDELIADGALCAETCQVFRIDGKPIRLYRHQAQAVAKAAAGKSFVVTTGTGSGKSLCFFVPIVDHAIRARIAGEPPRTKAIVIYPMNALANSQMKELEKFLEQSDLPHELRPTFARYTGQESDEEREAIRQAKPDILLTNFMMLELLMVRQNERDKAVIGSAEGLDFLVLDELHTYRGRQGADVAMLVRRVRDRLCRDKAPICIGTSATMSSDDGGEKKAETIASVASRLFGCPVGADAVIDESLERATDPSLTVEKLASALAASIDEEIPFTITDDELRWHPLAVWIELEIGLHDGKRLTRRKPTTIDEAAKRLHDHTGKPLERCRSQLEAMLTLMSQPAKERGGSGDRAFMAFKLHRFISGAGHAYATLRTPGKRRVTVEGQLFDPADPEARLYPTFFCRNCGQEYHPVSRVPGENGLEQLIPRSIDDVPIDDPNSDEVAGYLMPEPVNDPEFEFSGEPAHFPDEWLEQGPSGSRLKADRRKFAPQLVYVRPDGWISEDGQRCWFIPGKFRFCLACRSIPPAQAREMTKLASLSAEGRSSATTLLVSSILRWMNDPKSAVPEKKRKLLSFTDNRQDAALQAGHFNDFIFVSLLRAATLAAVRKAGAEGLSDEEFGSKVQAALGFIPERDGRRREWMLDPDVKGVAQINASRTLARVLAHRVWADQRRGWRYTNPNLEELALVRAEYLALDDLANDEAAFADGPVDLKNAGAETRRRVLTILFDFMRRGLAVDTEVLDPTKLEEIASASRQTLREPWAIGSQEHVRTLAALMVEPPRREEAGVRGESLVIRAGARSALARALNRTEFWGRRLRSEEYLELLTTLLQASESYGILRSVKTPFDANGWRLVPNAVRLMAGEGQPKGKQPNPYFSDLYETLANDLMAGGTVLFGFEGREHTAQVDRDRREWREWRFRRDADDEKRLQKKREDLRAAGEPDRFLPVLFCSPTMELGVDISALNAVYLRNVPPTPANYAQRSGRAGRSGQAALVVTYCSAQGPHDQYYFNRPADMVSGIVRPPALELANRDLIEAHLHAVWLAEAGRELSADIPGILDLGQSELPVRSTIASDLTRPDLAKSSAAAMKRILDSIDSELTPEAAPWAIDREAFAAQTAARAFARFSAAFDRWRQLYLSARTQLEEANRRSEIPGLSPEQRKEAKNQQAQANDQIALLEKGTDSGNSDFYSYRYLATEGFLPGYNFPRLPLYAFIPAAGRRDGRAAYLQRARFLAIAEFGPRSLIYHEGRAYRVHKAKLPAGLHTPEGKLSTATLYVCDNCGAAHAEEPERCHACGEPMGGVHPVRNVLRIDNVETVPAERITANDEERQRQGFEIQTVFSWPVRDGRLDVASALASDVDGPILRIDYALGALISRLNKGLRRRAEKSILGFGIDPATGRWTKGPDEDDPEPDTPAKQLVVPIVQDTKNAALFRFVEGPYSDEVVTTLQHALARGLEMVFQLEEGEIMTEPTPSRENRNAILAFEAAEGGAGVLGRLIAVPTALARVAKAALQLMHVDNIDQAIEQANPELLDEQEASECVKGCYRCLLSYYNQPDHELIDRTNAEVRRVLLRLARSEVKPLLNNAPVKSPWSDALARWKLPPPDAQPLSIGGMSFPLVWRAHLVVAATTDVDPLVQSELAAKGFLLVKLPSEPGETAPSNLISALRG